MTEFWPIIFVAIVLLGVAGYVIYRAKQESRKRPAGEDTELGSHPL
ncbi:hypothetical protein ACWX0K_20515 [Nitrobacteraceae bacterium UC4446_H13]